MDRYSNLDMANQLVANPDLGKRNPSLRLSPENRLHSPSKPLGGGQSRQKQEKQAQPQVSLSAQGSTRRKYRNVPVVIEGERFDSKKEARRYGELVLLERSGDIRSLTRQRTFDLSVNKVKICDYRCDFEYFELDRATGVWTWIVEDVKSDATRRLAAYRYKKRLMKALWTVDIRET